MATFDDRKSQRLLFEKRAQGSLMSQLECRVFIDEDGAACIVWWDYDPDAKVWVSDQGAKVPKAARAGLIEFLLEHHEQSCVK